MQGKGVSARVELSSDAGVSQEVGTGSLCEVEKFCRYDACSGALGVGYYLKAWKPSSLLYPCLGVCNHIGADAR